MELGAGVGRGGPEFVGAWRRRAGPWGAGGGGAGEGQDGGDLGRCRAPEATDLPRDLDRSVCSLVLSGSDP